MPSAPSGPSASANDAASASWTGAGTAPETNTRGRASMPPRSNQPAVPCFANCNRRHAAPSAVRGGKGAAMTIERNDRGAARPRGVFALALFAALIAAVTASAARAVVPQNTAPPTVTGNAREGETLSVSNGSWNGSPTKFAYQWQRCSADGTGCADIAGAQSANYNVSGADTDHTLRVQVTASNADGQSTSTSKTTDLVSSKGDPQNTVKPSVSG